MELEHSFTVPVPRERAWNVLLDVERVAPCMPGATVTSVDGDVVHATIKVRVGPINMAYAGTARFVDKDEATGVVLLEASGKETRGAGTAAAKIRSVLEDRGAETYVTVLTTLNVTGKPAQFGRGVMNEVSGKLLTIFAANLAALLAEPEGSASGDPAAAEGAQAGAADGASHPSAVTDATAGNATAGNATSGNATSGNGTADNGTAGDGQSAILATPLDELSLPARAAGSLRREGLTTAGQVAAKTAAELLAIDGIGPASVEDIKAKLADRGLTLGQRTPGAAMPAGPISAQNGETGAAAGAATAGAATAGSPAPASTGAPANSVAPASPGGNGSGKPAGATPDHEALNLIKVAGLPILKRLLPVLSGLVTVLLIGLLRRLKRRKG